MHQTRILRHKWRGMSQYRGSGSPEIGTERLQRFSEAHAGSCGEVQDSNGSRRKTRRGRDALANCPAAPRPVLDWRADRA